MMAAMTLALFFGSLVMERPLQGALYLQCDPNAKVALELQYGRFAENFAKLEMTSPFSSELKKGVIPGVYQYQYPNPVLLNGQFSIYAYSVTKSSTLKYLKASCAGLTQATVVKDSTHHEIVMPVSDSTTSFNWPRDSVADFNWFYWLSGFFTFSSLIFIFLLECRNYFRYPAFVDKAIPFAIFGLLAAIYLYYFPGFINPYNPTALFLHYTQKKMIMGFEGIFYSLLMNSIVEFMPRIQLPILIQNFVVFLFASRFISIGKTTKQRLFFLMLLVVVFFISPWMQLYTQYLERGVFTSWCFALFLLIFFSKLLEDRQYFEKSKVHAALIFFGAFCLALLRNEFLVVLLPVLFFLSKNYLKKLVIVSLFLWSALTINSALDQIEQSSQNWRFKYYVVSLMGYFIEIANYNSYTEDEKAILSKYMNVEKIKGSREALKELKEFVPGDKADLRELAGIIFKYFKKDPVTLFWSRMKYGLVSIGASPAPPWLYTTPIRPNFYDERLALHAEVMGSVKLKGDPFDSKRIYNQSLPNAPYLFSFGFIFIITGLFLYKFFPVSSIVCWALIFKFGVVSLLAPDRSMHYAFDIYLFCILIPFLAWAERQNSQLMRPSSIR